MTRIRRTKTGETSLGQPIYDDASQARKVYGWAPTSETERNEAAMAGRTISELTLYTPDTDWSANDKIVVDGESYEAIGGPQNFNHGPFGYQPGCTLNLRRVADGQA